MFRQYVCDDVVLFTIKKIVKTKAKHWNKKYSTAHQHTKVEIASNVVCLDTKVRVLYDFFNLALIIIR